MTSVSVITKLAEKNEETWMMLGRLAEKMNDTDRALHSFESVLRHQPYNLKALTQIASIYRSKDQYSKAVEYYHRALNVDNENCEIWGALGHCFLMMDDLQKAYAAYHQAIFNAKVQQRNKQDPHLWYGIGILYERYGSLDNAEEAFSSVIKMDLSFEKNNEIYFRLGIIYKQQMRYDQSLECFGNILNNPPSPLTQADIWFQIGHVYELKKDFEEAKKSYEHVLKYNPNHAKVLQQLGWLYHQNTQFGNQDVAISYLQRSIEADASDGQTWYLLGRCFMAQQKYRLAYDAYQQAVFRDGRNPTFWCSIGVLYYQINQYRDALDAYSRAIRLNPYLSEVWYDLGTLYESCNQISDALDAYQRAAELDPKNKHIQQRLNMLRNQSMKPTDQKSQNSGQLAPINTVEPQNMGNMPRPGNYPHDNAPPVPIQPKSGASMAPPSFNDLSRMHNGPGPSSNGMQGPPSSYGGNGPSLPSMNSGPPPPNPNVTLNAMSSQQHGHPNAPSASPYNTSSGYMSQYASNAPPQHNQQRPPGNLPPPSRNAPSPYHGKPPASQQGSGAPGNYGQYPPPHHQQQQQQQGPPTQLPPQSHHSQQMPPQQQQQHHQSHGGYGKGGYPEQGVQYNRTSPHPQLPPMSHHSQHQGPPPPQQQQQPPMNIPSMKDQMPPSNVPSNDHLKRTYEEPAAANKRPKHSHPGPQSSQRRGNIDDEEEDEDEMVINEDDDADSQRRKRGTPNSFNRGPTPDDNSYLHSNSRSRFVSKKKNPRTEPPSLAVNNKPDTNIDTKKDE